MVANAGIPEKERSKGTIAKRNDSGDELSGDRGSKSNKCGTDVYERDMGCYTGSMAEAL